MDNTDDDRDALGLPFIPNPAVPEWAQNIDKQIHWYGFGLLSFLGFGLNCVVLWVWWPKPKYSPMVFLFKTLAVFDNAFILFFNVWWFFQQGSMAEFVLQAFAFGAQYMSVNITLVLTVCQWISVFLHSRAKSLLSKRRIAFAVGALMVFCAAIKIAERLQANFHPDKSVNIAFNVAIASVVLMLPVAIQLLLTASLAWHAYHCVVRVAHAPDGDTTGAMAMGSRCDAREKLGAGIRSWKPYSKRRLTYTVIAINVSTLLTYPAGTVVNMYLLMAPHALQVGWKRVVTAIITLTQIINSAVNFFFYVFFLISFRRLLVMNCTTPNHYYSLSSSFRACKNSQNFLEDMLRDGVLQPSSSASTGGALHALAPSGSSQTQGETSGKTGGTRHLQSKQQRLTPHTTQSLSEEEEAEHIHAACGSQSGAQHGEAAVRPLVSKVHPMDCESSTEAAAGAARPEH